MIWKIIMMIIDYNFAYDDHGNEMDDENDDL